MSKYGLSELEYQIILKQIERRAKYRKEFLRLKGDPCQNSLEAGHVFDPAIQRFLSMKECQYEYFRPTFKTARFGLIGVILPMVLYGSLVWTQRQKFESDCRSGILRYRDRIFKYQ